MAKRELCPGSLKTPVNVRWGQHNMRVATCGNCLRTAPVIHTPQGYAFARHFRQAAAPATEGGAEQ